MTVVVENLLFADVCFQPHPGMDAALIFLDAFLLLDVRFERSTRWDIHGGGAFGRDGSQMQDVVECLHLPSAELLDFRERMRLTTLVHREETLSDQQVWIRRGKVPCTNASRASELFDELLE